MRVLVRLISLVFLIASVITGSLDVIQSFAASALVLTRLGPVWQSLQPGGFEAVTAFVATLPLGAELVKAVEVLVTQPVSALCLVLSLLLWMIAWRKPRLAGRFAA